MSKAEFLYATTIAIQSVVFLLALEWGGKWADYAMFIFAGIGITVAIGFLIAYKWRQKKKNRNGNFLY